MNKLIIPILIFAVVCLCFLNWLAQEQMAQAARLIITGGTVTILGMLAVTLLAWVLILGEKVLTFRATRKAAQRDAGVMVIRANEREQVYVREENKKAVYRPLHLNPAQYQNGRQQEPSAIELALYRLWHSKPAQVQVESPMLLEANTLPELLPILDSAQRVLVIGASGAGKTNLLQWVASRRVGAVIVIDPHAAPNKWPQSCRVVGAGSNHPEIETTLDNLISLMVTRYKEISAGLVREGEHPKLTIVIDEWMSIAYQCSNAQEVMVRLLTESRKAAFSVIIGSHSERVKSLGLDGKGDLRDGFLFVRLWAENGQHQASFDYGRGERPCLLPGKFEQIQEGEVIEVSAITEPKPTEQEQQILDLHQTGASFNEIARQVLGSAGGKQTLAIKNVLTKYEQI